MRKIPFIKMDGLGNDFMIIDEREKSYELTSEDIVKLANRKTGVGFDQMIILRKPSDTKLYAAKMVIFNADGSSAGACGNGTRCVGKLLLDEVFGRACFQREIIWDTQVLSGYKTLAENWIRGHDSVLFYTREPSGFNFNKQKMPH